MTKIFISYRREDSGMGTGRIYDRLEAHFGAENLFFDIDSIPLGVDFRKHLDEKIRSCDVVLAVIGNSWLGIVDESGQRRLHSPQDFVRTEIELALQRDIPVIPVLLDGVRMPSREELPDSIAELTYRNAARVDTLSFGLHMERLIRGLDHLIASDVSKGEAASDLNQAKKRKVVKKPSRSAKTVGKPSTGHRSKVKSSAKQPSVQMNQEAKRLLAEIEDLTTKPQRRLEIGDCLAKLGDPRQGIGLNEQGFPDIDWVEIPAGVFIYGEGKSEQELHLETFHISRYPITNAQYQAFINAGSYRGKLWWQDLKRPEPRKSTWDQPNRPRTNVDWYEAVAFTRWLSAQLNKPIRLPTEQEWEKAARGTNGSRYPWGDRYINGYANLNESGNKGVFLKQTTAVGLYPMDKSPYGVRDLVGNVCEWCLNKYDSPEEVEPDTSGVIRVLRGGYWWFLPNIVSSANRYSNLPESRLDSFGIRVVLSTPIE